MIQSRLHTKPYTTYIEAMYIFCVRVNRNLTDKNVIQETVYINTIQWIEAS